MKDDQLRLWGHKALVRLEAIDKTATSRIPKAYEQRRLEQNIEALRKLLFRLIGTK